VTARAAAVRRRTRPAAGRRHVPDARRFERLRRWLVVASAGFALLGVAIALDATGPLLDAWHAALARRFFPDGADAAAVAVRDFLLGPFGATIAARWIVMAWLFHEPFRRHERWAWRAASWSLWAWLALDVFVCGWQRAWFNVALIDLWPAVLVGVPLWLVRDDMRA
jgi:hypothetical protein